MDRLARSVRGAGQPETRGFVKIVAERASGRIVGATAVNDKVGDVIQAAVYAIQLGPTTGEIVKTWAPYLTFAEAFKLAAQTFKTRRQQA